MTGGERMIERLMRVKYDEQVGSDAAMITFGDTMFFRDFCVYNR